MKQALHQIKLLLVLFLTICSISASAQEDLILDYDLGSDSHYLDSTKMFYLGFRLPSCSNFEITEVGAHIAASSSSGVVKLGLFDKDFALIWESAEINIAGGVDEYVYADINQGDVALTDMEYYYVGIIGKPDGDYIRVNRKIDPVNNGVANNTSTSSLGQYTDMKYPDFPNPAKIDIAWYGAVNLVVKGVPAMVTITPNQDPLEQVSSACVTSLSAPSAVASCDGTIYATTEDPTEYTADGTYTVTWTYKKGYYYSVDQTQTIVVDDVTDPEIPTLEHLYGDTSLVIVPPVTNDDCVGEVTGTTTDQVKFTEHGEYTITWTFDDGNGNSVTADQQVTITNVTSTILDYELGHDVHYLDSSKMFYLDFRLPECSNFELTEIGAHINAGSSSGKVKFALFNNHRALLWESEEVNVTGGIDEYVFTSIPRGDIALTDMEFYYIGMIGDPEEDYIHVQRKIFTHSAENLGVAINTASSTIGQYMDIEYPDFPDTANIDIAWYGAVNMVAKGVPAHVDIFPDADTIMPDTVECPYVTAPTATLSCGGRIYATTNDFDTTIVTDGTYIVTWTFKEGYYYAIEQQQVLVVNDTTKPTAPVLPDTTAICLLTLEAPLALDNCVGYIKATTDDDTTFFGYGNYTVTWVFDDGNGNSISVDQNVIIGDTLLPQISCIENQEIDLAAGETEYIISGSEFDAYATDSCGIDSVWNSINNTSSLDGEALDPGLTSITWTVVDMAGNTESCTFEVQVNDNVGLASNTKGRFKVYPNPSKGIVYVDSELYKTYSVTLIDLQGKVLLHKANCTENNELDISNLETGVYLVRIHANNELVNFRIIKE